MSKISFMEKVETTNTKYLLWVDTKRVTTDWTNSSSDYTEHNKVTEEKVIKLDASFTIMRLIPDS